MSGNSNFKTTESIKPGYNERKEPRDIPQEFQEEYIEACREVNGLLVDADRYFAHNDAYKILDGEEENFRQNEEYELEVSEVVDRANIGELVEEDKFYDQLIDIAGSESIEDVSQLASAVLEISTARDRIGEEMDYNNPVTWMMYKREAYDGQSIENGDPNDEITTIGDLRQHADGQDLCQKRYKFLLEFTQENTEWNIDDQNNIPDETPLEEVYSDERILSLLTNQEFMGQPSDGANVVDPLGNDMTAEIGLKEGGRGSWLGNEKDADGKWNNF